MSMRVGRKLVESMWSWQSWPAGVWPGQRARRGTGMPASVVSRLPPGMVRWPIGEAISGRGAVVGVEEDDGVFGEAEGVEGFEEFAHVAVEVGDHVFEVFGIVVQAVDGGPVVAEGGGVEGAVGEAMG